MFIITNLLFHFHLAGFRKKNSKFIINYNMVAARDRECASQPTSNPAINSLREKRCFFFFFILFHFQRNIRATAAQKNNNTHAKQLCSLNYTIFDRMRQFDIHTCADTLHEFLYTSQIVILYAVR